MSSILCRRNHRNSQAKFSLCKMLTTPPYEVVTGDKMFSVQHLSNMVFKGYFVCKKNNNHHLLHNVWYVSITLFLCEINQIVQQTVVDSEEHQTVQHIFRCFCQIIYCYYMPEIVGNFSFFLWCC